MFVSKIATNYISTFKSYSQIFIFRLSTFYQSHYNARLLSSRKMRNIRAKKTTSKIICAKIPIEVDVKRNVTTTTTAKEKTRPNVKTNKTEENEDEEKTHTWIIWCFYSKFILCIVFLWVSLLIAFANAHNASYPIYSVLMLTQSNRLHSAAPSTLPFHAPCSNFSVYTYIYFFHFE